MNTACFSRVCLSMSGSALLVIALLLFLLPFGAQARPALAPTAVTRYVSPTGNDVANVCASSVVPCRTVQHAVDMSQNGDEVRVAQGTYTGTMAARSATGSYSATVVLTKNLSALLGGYSADFSLRNPGSNETILSAADAPRKFVVFISDTTTLVDGFTMTGATGACPTDCVAFRYGGGAIGVRDGAPTISHNRIQGNRAYRYGGGIYVGQSAAPVIAANIIYSNTASFHELGGLGGGIYIASGSAVITSNVIVSNVADVEGGGIFVGWNVPASIVSNTVAYNQVISAAVARGGGIRTLGDSAIVTISHNEIYSNALAGGGGGGLDISSPAIIDSNHIHHNKVVHWGGGVVIDNVTLPVTLTNNVIAWEYNTGIDAINFGELHIINNTVADNSWDNIDVFAWPVAPPNPFTATILNNIIANGGGCGINAFNGATVIGDYNDLYQNQPDYCGLANPPSGIHNTSADPQLVNPSAGNFHIRFGSPAMNTGTKTYAPGYDKDGVKRPQMGRVDMGAYEVVAPYSVYLPTILK